MSMHDDFRELGAAMRGLRRAVLVELAPLLRFCRWLTLRLRAAGFRDE